MTATADEIDGNPDCIGKFDAREWARDFLAAVHRDPEIATDEGTMIGWFANAIMAGYDHALDRVATQPEQP
jgi:hypothetical protein